MLISLLQPTPEIYNLFDDIMVLSEGEASSPPLTPHVQGQHFAPLQQTGSLEALPLLSRGDEHAMQLVQSHNAHDCSRCKNCQVLYGPFKTVEKVCLRAASSSCFVPSGYTWMRSQGSVAATASELRVVVNRQTG